MKIVCVIPARGGSKRIPRKNIKDFCGKPMIAWSIEAALRTGCFDRTIVSTDSREIADVARQWGAEVPFMRPVELAGDYVGTTAVLAHATEWMQERNWCPRAVCCVYATAPFVVPRDLQSGLRVILSGEWEYAFSATHYSSTIFRSFREHPEGGVEMLFPEHFGARSQDLPVVLHDAGQFYWGTPDAWVKELRLFGRWSFPIVIPRWRVQDIDTEDDWRHAELIFGLTRNEGER